MAAFSRTCCGHSWLAHEGVVVLSTFLLVNPAAGRGRAAGLIPAARFALERIGGATVLETRYAGDEAIRTREALQQGASTIVVLGGDGTVSQVAAEMVRARTRVPLAIFGAGTGNDFARSLGAPVHNFAAMARLIAARAIRRVDAGRVDDCFFVNSAGFGFDVEVLQHLVRTGKNGGISAYAQAALRLLFRYQGFDAELVGEPHSELGGDRAGNQPEGNITSGQWLTLVFANGGWFGGAFKIAPGFSIGDGLLDQVAIRNTSPARRAMLFARALRGAHVGQREVTVDRNRKWTLVFREPPVYQVDGELRQAPGNTVQVDAVPQALCVITQMPTSP